MHSKYVGNDFFKNKILMEESILACEKLKSKIFWLNFVTQWKCGQCKSCSHWWKLLKVCRWSKHLKEDCWNRASMTSSSKSVDGDTNNVTKWCVSFLCERLVYSFWCGIEKVVLLLTSPQDMHIRYGLVFMQDAWWNFDIDDWELLRKSNMRVCIFSKVIDMWI